MQGGTMEDEDESLIYLAGGGIGAVLLGMVLVPMRDFTTASNFTFPFMALTIAVAEFGGRRPAVVTALMSALSLDFFLTKPYLKLTIADKHDIIAFLGLAGCGLVAAAVSSRRRRKVTDLAATRGHLDLLHAALHRLEATDPSEPVLERVLDEARAVLPLSVLVARDGRGAVIAASGGEEERPVPLQSLRPDTLLPPEISARDLPRRGVPLPPEGGRLPLTKGNRRVGSLELWGSGAPADAETRRTLSDVGRLVTMWLACSGRLSGAP